MAPIKKGDLEVYTAVCCVNTDCEEFWVVHHVVPDDFWGDDDDEVCCYSCNEPLDCCEIPEPSITARFTPQAWVSDHAIEIDASGPTEWDATEAFYALPDDYKAFLLAEMDEEHSNGEALDQKDLLKNDPRAPEWIREHRGPFDIHVRLMVDEALKG